MSEILEIAGREIPPGQRRSISIPVARHGHAEMSVPAHVVHGRSAGPRLFVSGAIHGDELLGVEVIRRLLRSRSLRSLRGALIAVPVVNVYGFLTRSRYLPDRRDLNRSFPGSPSGSLAARLAHQFMREVVAHATHGIDLHSGALHRANLPQVRVHLDDPESERLARAFETPVIVDARLRDGSLRQAVVERGIPVLVYEAGEALRFDEFGIRAGLRGILSVMRAIGMLPDAPGRGRRVEPFVARSSHWVRAPESGILRSRLKLGARIEPQQQLAVISSPLDDLEVEVRALRPGILIGRNQLPLVNEGDAVFHVASFDRPSQVAREVETFQEELLPSEG